MRVPDKTTLPRGICGYTDLLIVYGEGGLEALAAMAGLVGFGLETKSKQVFQPEGILSDEAVVQETIKTEPKEFRIADQLPVPFWHLVHCEFLSPLPRVVSSSDQENGEESQPRMPDGVRLGGWNGVMTRLRAWGTVQISGARPDQDRLVRCVVQGRVLDRLPRLSRRRWGRGIQIILDRSQRLIPFQDDLDWAALRLAALFPRQAVEFVLLRETCARPVIVEPGNRFRKYVPPDPGALVLALGDMGALAPDAARKAALWEQWGKRLRRHGCRLLALSPAPAWRMRPRRLPSWILLPWERGGAGVALTREEINARTERLLALLVPAVRIETGLLREIRLLLGNGADAGTEADCWTHPAMVGRSTMGGTLDPNALDWLWPRFAGEKETLKEQVVASLRRWHNREGLGREVWDEEVLRLPASLTGKDHAAARSRFKKLSARVVDSELGEAWFRRVHRRADPTDLYQHGDRELKSVQDAMFAAAFRDEPNRPPPPGFDLRHLPPRHETPVAIPLFQRGDYLVAGTAASGSPLGVIYGTQDQLHLEPGLFLPPADDSPDFWQGGVPPPWAASWGWDTYGAWVVFTHEGVQQRLRWIPPGRFLMGSPKEERGRSDDEGPQREVTIKQGFWLFDTACTQALWQAVMRDNPSEFQSPDRPVENVDFKNVQTFLKKINQAHPDLELILPSEAQWEYACRAGTTTPFSFGEDITPELVNYDGNHPYRDGPNGECRQQTVPVASLPPNPWGLYEMHGNVWEWCADAWHDTYAKAPTDGSVWEGPTADRVLRGGSWGFYARGVRAAYRYRVGLAYRYGFQGFRCARVQVSQAGQAAEPMIPAFGPQAERGPTPGSSGTAKLFNLQGDGKQAMVPLPKRSAFVIKSDREILTFGQIEKPSWAEAMGRDHHGLWTRIAIPGPGSQPITQRLRWIPPGRFLMGSPEEEHGRLDREGPQHEVTFKQGFWLFDTACTQALWQVVMEGNPSRFKSPDRPVERVGFEHVQKFLNKINQDHPGLELTLPSEAQWEYACRAGTTTPFSFGEDITPEQVNYNGKHPYRDGPKGEYREQTVPVASLPPNPWGLYEMHGNVWEWCADAWHESYAEAPADGSVWDGQTAVRVLRGGSWYDHSRFVRTAVRGRISPTDRYGNQGFRCARVQS